jgi:hypothetical protein
MNAKRGTPSISVNAFCHAAALLTTEQMLMLNRRFGLDGAAPMTLREVAVHLYGTESALLKAKTTERRALSMLGYDVEVWISDFAGLGPAGMVSELSAERLENLWDGPRGYLPRWPPNSYVPWEPMLTTDSLLWREELAARDVLVGTPPGQFSGRWMCLRWAPKLSHRTVEDCEACVAARQLPIQSAGRRRAYCSDACRQRACRARRSLHRTSVTST